MRIHGQIAVAGEITRPGVDKVKPKTTMFKSSLYKGSFILKPAMRKLVWKKFTILVKYV